MTYELFLPVRRYAYVRVHKCAECTCLLQKERRKNSSAHLRDYLVCAFILLYGRFLERSKSSVFNDFDGINVAV